MEISSRCAQLAIVVERERERERELDNTSRLKKNQTKHQCLNTVMLYMHYLSVVDVPP